MTIRVEARLATPVPTRELEQFAVLFSHLERRLIAALNVRGEQLAAAKRRFLAEHRIRAWQFNSLHKQLSAKVASWREVRQFHLATVAKQPAKAQRESHRAQSADVVHQQQRRRQRLRDRYLHLERKLAAAVPSIRSGSRARFRAQFHLRENGYADHAGWQREWCAARATAFFLLGSADERCGNQTCQNRHRALHLRLPDALGDYTLTLPV